MKLILKCYSNAKCSTKGLNDFLVLDVNMNENGAALKIKN